MRFPQPVRAGDLLGREVLRPVESQDVLGRVRRIVRDRNGQIMVVIDFGGFLGFGSRPIAVPVDAMVLIGQDMEIVAFTPKQLRQFPTFSPSGTTDVADDTIIKVGLAKPSHKRSESRNLRSFRGELRPRARLEEVRFALDSPLEGAEFEPPVPPKAPGVRRRRCRS